MSEKVFFDVYGDRFYVQRAERGNGYQRVNYRFDVKLGRWVPHDVVDYAHFDDFLLDALREQFSKTDCSPLEIFDVADVMMKQMTESVIRVRDL